VQCVKSVRESLCSGQSVCEERMIVCLRLTIVILP
jgi:hypothetical protein